MKRRYIFMWYFSVGLYIVSLIPFIDFMYNLTVEKLKILMLFFVVATALYVISTKLVSFPEGYTAIQAMRFYNACKKEQISKLEQCKNKTQKLKEIASRYEFTKNLEQDDLLIVYERAVAIYNRKEK